jgi:Tol biopolymer transport system component
VVKEAQVITIVTRPAAPPRPVEISYAAEGLTFLPPGRLVKDVDTGTWAPGGQEVLFTRPAGAAPPLPSATGTPSASPAPRSAAPAGRARTTVGVVGVGRGREAVLLDGNLPVWSPSGKQLAFWRPSGDANELVVAPRTAQGMGPVSVVAGGDPSVAPVWLSEDSLALISGGKVQVVRLTPGEAARPVGPASGPPPSRLVASPDGRYLALIGADGITLIELQGNIRRVFLPGAVALAWSADGKRLAYSDTPVAASPSVAPTPSGTAPAGPSASPTSSGTPAAGASASPSAAPGPAPSPPPPAPPAPARLFVAGADGGEAQAILTGAAGERFVSLSWSPDGRALLFARGAGAVAHAGVVNADGSSPKAVANDLEILSAAWSPSGDHVLYLHRDEDGNHSLWTQAVSTTGVSGETQELVRAYDAVTTFMQARLKGDADGARALLVEDAVPAFAGREALLGRSNPRFARFLIVSRQATAKGSEFLVRIVQRGAKGAEVSYFEETLRLEKRGVDYRIVGAQVSTTTLITPGPSVIKVEKQDATVRVAFDSDLDTTAVNDQAIYIQTAAGARVEKTVIVLSPPDRSILLQLPRGLEPGSYLLKVTTQLRDANGLPLAQDYLWPFVVKAPSPDESGGTTNR